MIITLDTCRKGNPIQFDTDDKHLIYKENRVSLYDFEKGLKSPIDRIQLAPNLTMVKNEGFVHLGCLCISEERIKELKIKLLKQLK